MNHKSKTQHLLESFITFAQNQFQTSIKTIRVDNELEFISIRNFFLEKGIECHFKHSTSPPISVTIRILGMCFNRHIYHLY